MYKAQLNKVVRECRFVLKSSAPHHGAWRYVKTELNNLQHLNTQTFFSVNEISDAMTTPSAIHFIFGDKNNTEHTIPTDGLTAEQIDEIVKEEVKFGLTLQNESSWSKGELPVDIIEAHKYVRHIYDRV